MKEQPILFSGEMVRAILEGRKTQTRRVIKFPRQKLDPDISWIKSVHQDGKGNWIGWSFESEDLADQTKRLYPNGEGFPCPYGQPGDKQEMIALLRTASRARRQEQYVFIASSVNLFASS